MLTAAIKIFILLAPFFILSVFIAQTETMSLPVRRRIAIRASVAILLIAFIVYFAGNVILSGLGITLDAFRIGSGLVLLLSGLEMVRGSSGNSGSIRDGKEGKEGKEREESSNDIAIVPLAIPCAVGPGTIGALLVMGSNAFSDLSNSLFDLCGVFIAVSCIAALLYYANNIEHLIKKRGISILSKLTGLFLTALAAQIITQGVKNLI